MGTNGRVIRLSVRGSAHMERLVESCDIVVSFK